MTILLIGRFRVRSADAPPTLSCCYPSEPGQIRVQLANEKIRSSHSLPWQSSLSSRRSPASRTRSRMRNRNEPVRAARSMTRLRACWAVQAQRNPAACLAPCLCTQGAGWSYRRMRWRDRRHWRCDGENTSLIALMASTASTSAVVIRVAAGAGAAAGWPGSACPGRAASRRSESVSAAVSRRRCCRK